MPAEPAIAAADAQQNAAQQSAEVPEIVPLAAVPATEIAAPAPQNAAQHSSADAAAEASRRTSLAGLRRRRSPPMGRPLPRNPLSSRSGARAGRTERRPHKPRRPARPQQARCDCRGGARTCRDRRRCRAGDSRCRRTGAGRAACARRPQGRPADRQQRQERHERQQRIGTAGQDKASATSVKPGVLAGVRRRPPRGDRPRRDKGNQVERAEREQYYAKPFGGSENRNKQPDPNSPFAKLAALKQQLEQNTKEPS